MRKIPLTQNKFALVDDSDFESVSRFKWCAQGTGNGRFYAARRAQNRIELLHRRLLNAVPGQEVDHINGDSLDNRRENLRLASRLENSRNIGKQKPLATSRYKGVCFVPQLNKTNPWIAYIGGSLKCGARLKRRYLGYFSDETKAALAYDRAARVEFKEFAKLNFPNE